MKEGENMTTYSYGNPITKKEKRYYNHSYHSRNIPIGQHIIRHTWHTILIAIVSRMVICRTQVGAVHTPSVKVVVRGEED